MFSKDIVLLVENKGFGIIFYHNENETNVLTSDSFDLPTLSFFKLMVGKSTIS